MTKTISLFFTICAALSLLSGCASSGPAFQSMSADSLMQYAARQLEDHDWDDAITALQQFTFQFPSHPRYQEARFKLGEAYFGKKEFITAASEFARLSVDFPSGEYSDDSRFKVCDSYARLSPRAQLDQQYTVAAVDHCASLVAYFPDSPFAAQATEIANDMRNKLAQKMFQAGEFYFKLRAWHSAVQYFDQALQDYPTAQVTPRVLLRLYESYQELGYRDEAQTTRERLLRDFPTSEEAKRIRGIAVAGGA